MKTPPPPPAPEGRMLGKKKPLIKYKAQLKLIQFLKVVVILIGISFSMTTFLIEEYSLTSFRVTITYLIVYRVLNALKKGTKQEKKNSKESKKIEEIRNSKLENKIKSTYYFATFSGLTMLIFLFIFIWGVLDAKQSIVFLLIAFTAFQASFFFNKRYRIEKKIILNNVPKKQKL